jgi:hypothetical protein
MAVPPTTHTPCQSTNTYSSSNPGLAHLEPECWGDPQRDVTQSCFSHIPERGDELPIQAWAMAMEIDQKLEPGKLPLPSPHCVTLGSPLLSLGCSLPTGMNNPRLCPQASQEGQLRWRTLNVSESNQSLVNNSRAGAQRRSQAVTQYRVAQYG